MNLDLIRLGAIVTLIVTGVLLLADALQLSTGLALVSFALAAAVVSALSWRP